MIPELGILALMLALGALRLPGIPGALFAYPWLGLVPGLALAAWLEPRASRPLQWTLGLAAAPVVSTAGAWLLIRAGLGFRAAALGVAIAGAVALMAARSRHRASGDPAARGIPRAAIRWGLGLAAILFVLPWVNHYLLIRGDSWIHGGIVMELLERGFPPEDARMAGVRLNYVWFFNFFVALQSTLSGHDPFPFMAVLNVASGFAMVALVGTMAARLSDDPRAPAAAAALLTLGLNAGAFLLWPVHLVRALVGEVRGMPEVVRQIRGIEFGSANILYYLHAPFAHMVSFLDKLLVGSALGFAYLQMTLFLWALLVWLGDGRRSALAWLAAGVAGMMLFHSVVGLSVLPVALGVLALAWWLAGRWTWLPARGRLAWAVAAALAGALATAPYLRSITSGWAPERAGFEHRFFHFGPVMPWTLVTACFFVLILLPRPLAESWRKRRGLAIVIAGFAAAMTVFALVVHMPQNNEVKFVYQVFTPLVLLTAPAFAQAAGRLWSTRRALALALASLFLVPALLTVHGYLIDASGNTRGLLVERPGEARLYDWLRAETPPLAVLVDRGFRDVIAVRARRRLFLGTDRPPGLAAFPAPEMRRRQRVMGDLYGPLAEPESTVSGLLVLGRPIFVLYRPEDSLATPEPWQRLVEAAPGARVVYARDGYHVVQMPGAGS